MSFQNFDSFPNQDAAAAAGAPAQADTNMTGQADPAGAPFQGAAGDAAAAPGPQQGADGKTTLWYVLIDNTDLKFQLQTRLNTDFPLQDGRA